MSVRVRASEREREREIEIERERESERERVVRGGRGVIERKENEKRHDNQGLLKWESE